MDLQIRPYRKCDQHKVGQLFYDTVHSVNRRDYTQEQVDVWAPELVKEGLIPSLEREYAYVAEVRGQIVGFGDITRGGHLERLYIHKDFQRHGVASKILDALESKARELHLSEITTDASLTAKPFFLAKGYLVKEQKIKVRKDVPFVIFKMYKCLSEDKGKWTIQPLK